MAVSLRPQHLKRYRAIGRLLVKYGRSDIVRQAGLEDAVDGAGAGDQAPAEAAELASDLEQMGPTYIKLGQLLSTRADLLPEPYLHALARLQDDVAPFPWEDVEHILKEELGRPPSEAYASFEEEPFASASLGQVHKGTLHDGTSVAVKVQRPGIRDQVMTDMEALEEIAAFLDDHTEAGRRYGFTDMVREFRRSLSEELDYRVEAQNLKTLGRNLAEFRRLLVPQPVDGLTTTRVLTMQHVAGRKITSIDASAQMDIDGEGLADEVFRAYLQQVLADGFFHADPHPGNVLLTPDGRLALIDLGMVARVTPQQQDCLIRLLLAVSEGRGQEAAETMVGLGEALPAFDKDAFTAAVTELVARHQHVSVEHLDAGRVVVELSRVAAESGLRAPPALAMLGKALLNLDQVSRTLDPKFEPNAAVQRHSAELMRSHMWKGASQGNAFATLLETKEFVEKLPGRANRLMESLANNDFTVHVEAIDQRSLIRGLEKIANRVTMGLLLAALIVGAAMLMRVETEHRILGYPALAILFFLVAAGGALVLMVLTVVGDRRGGGGGGGGGGVGR